MAAVPAQPPGKTGVHADPPALPQAGAPEDVLPDLSTVQDARAKRAMRRWEAVLMLRMNRLRAAKALAILMGEYAPPGTVLRKEKIELARLYKKEGATLEADVKKYQACYHKYVTRAQQLDMQGQKRTEFFDMANRHTYFMLYLPEYAKQVLETSVAIAKAAEAAKQTAFEDVYDALEDGAAVAEAYMAACKQTSLDEGATVDSTPLSEEEEDSAQTGGTYTSSAFTQRRSSRALRTQPKRTPMPPSVVGGVTMGDADRDAVWQKKRAVNVSAAGEAAGVSVADSELDSAEVEGTEVGSDEGSEEDGSEVDSDEGSDEDGSEVGSDEGSDEDGSEVGSDEGSDEDGSAVDSDEGSEEDGSAVDSDEGSEEDGSEVGSDEGSEEDGSAVDSDEGSDEDGSAVGSEEDGSAVDSDQKDRPDAPKDGSPAEMSGSSKDGGGAAAQTAADSSHSPLPLPAEAAVADTFQEHRAAPSPLSKASDASPPPAVAAANPYIDEHGGAAEHKSSSDAPDGALTASALADAMALTPWQEGRDPLHMLSSMDGEGDAAWDREGLWQM